MPKEKLGLYLYKHPSSGIYQVRGSYLGVSVDESAGTRVERDAAGVLERRRREIYEEVVLEKPRVRSFAEAAIGYMNAGGDKSRMPRVLTAELKIEGRTRVFGEMMLNEIDQGVIDALAKHLMPDVKDSTRNREVYTPVSAVLQYAADQASWKFSKGRIRRPPTPLGRIDWRTPEEIQWWLDRAGGAKALLTAYVGTGARASELINLEWPNVSPASHRITLWETDTKAARARGIDLQPRVRGVIPVRPANAQGAVFLNSRGERWTRPAVEKALERITIREARLRASKEESERIAALVHRAGSAKFDADVRNAARKQAFALYEEIAERESVPWIHPHVLRHTWATWGYAVTRDLAWLMDQGGWAKPAMALRYTHVGSADLADEVLAYGWEIRVGLNQRPAALPAPKKSESGAA